MKIPMLLKSTMILLLVQQLKCQDITEAMVLNLSVKNFLKLKRISYIY